MPKLPPGLTRLASGSWQGRIRIADKVLTTSDPDRKTVEEWLELGHVSLRSVWSARRRGHAYGDDPRGDRTVIADLWEKYRARKDLKPRSVHHYESLWANHLEPRWARARVGDVKRWMVQEWVDGLNLAPATVESCWALLSGICRIAYEREWIDRNPAEGVKRPEVIHAEPELPTIEEMFALIDALPMYLRAMAVFGFACGMRLGEAAGVVRSKLDVSDYATAHVVVDMQRYADGTTGAPKSRGAGHYAKRTEPLPGWAVDYLREYLAWRGPMLPTAYVSISPTGGVVTSDGFRYQFFNAQTAVYGEVRGFTHKTLRHWHVSFLDAKGISEAGIQRNVGHRKGSTVTKQSYTQATEVSRAAIRTALDSITPVSRVARAWKRPEDS
jgi:integrase